LSPEGSFAMKWKMIGLALCLAAAAALVLLAAHAIVVEDIVAGCSWTDKPTAAARIDISFNKIHDVALLHHAAAGIYTLGNIPGCEIHDNYI